MPELPEVETIRQTLRYKVLGKEIADVSVRYPDIIQMDVTAFTHRLIGERIIEIGRRGKYLLFELDHYYLISHLRMEGKYFLRQKTVPMDKHDHVIFSFTDGTELRYNDVRKFGTMHLKGKDDLYRAEPLARLGPEPTPDSLTFTYLQDALLKRKAAIKKVLLDQEVIAGLGNIYVNEALFMARIHPEQPANTLKDEEIERLRVACLDIIERAIANGGTTIRSYYSDDEVSGRFQEHLLVHGRQGESCYTCGSPIIKMKVGGRGTYICPRCQRLRHRKGRQRKSGARR